MRSSETPTRLSPEEVAGRIVVRVAELRVIAARTALAYAQMETDAALAAFAYSLRRAREALDK